MPYEPPPQPDASASFPLAAPQSAPVSSGYEQPPQPEGAQSNAPIPEEPEQTDRTGAVKKIKGIIGPVAGLVQHARGEITPGAAYWGSALESLPVVGNLPRRGYEWATGKLHDLTGKGNTEEQQRVADEEYQQQLSKAYPGWGFAGTATGVGSTVGATMALTPSAPVAWMIKSPAGRAIWQGLLGAGTGGLTGFTTGEDLADRLHRAWKYGVIGGGLGLAGGTIGEGIASWLGKPAEAGAERAAEEAGISPYAKAASQEEKIGEALRAPGVEPIRPSNADLFEEGGLNPRIHSAVTQRAEQLHDAAVAMKQQAGTKGAMLSPDAFAGLRQTINQGLVEKGINLDALPKLDALSPARRALNLFDSLENTANQAAQAGKQVGLMNIEKTHQLINEVGKEAKGLDPVVKIVQHNFDKWLTDAVDAHMFSGDPSAIQDLFQWRKMYAGYKDFVSGDNALANILKKHQNPDQIANWFDAATRLGNGQEAASLAKSLKPIVGDDTWDMLRGLTLGKFAAPAEGGTLSGTQLASGLQKMLDAPVSRVLFKPDELKQWSNLAVALRGLPKNDPRIWRLATALGISGGIEGAAEGVAAEMFEHREEGINVGRLIGLTGLHAAAGFMLGRYGPGILRQFAPLIASGAAPVGTTAIANTPALSNIVGRATGGSVIRQKSSDRIGRALSAARSTAATISR